MILRLLILLLGLKADLTFAAHGYLAYGDLRGHIEPCGCDPSTDLGGIKRLGGMIVRERAVHPSLLLFDLGNNLPLASESNLKIPFLLSAQAVLAPDAILFNDLEMQRFDQLSLWLRQSATMVPPYILSNLRDKPDFKKLVRPFVSGKGWVAFGYVYNDSIRDVVIPWGPELLRQWRDNLLKHASDFRVLLFSGSDVDLRQAIESKLFEVIISSNTAKPDRVLGSEERYQESRLLRSNLPPVYMVPLGGQGFLRGGNLQLEEVKPLSELFGNKTTVVQERRSDNWLKDPKLVTWLDPATSSQNRLMDQVYESYTKAAQVSFHETGKKRLQQLKETSFAGAQVCVGCHPEASKVYLNSKHAKAMATLQLKSKSEDPECVACHSLGASEPGGFVSLDKSPQFANVQCENCHGPRLAHSRDPRPGSGPDKPSANVCISCHNGQHSPKFEFKSYWQRISHK